ncbi:MAG: CBS domain-containing protein [DPANN group archaeon]|nr:CBS domain-containing protein [DPANN group archaeon]
MDTGYKVGDVMTKRPIAVTGDTTIQRCAKIMEANHVGALIIQQGKKAQGIITEQDIVRRVVAENLRTAETRVADHMAKNLFTVHPDVDIFDAIKIMRDENIRHLPVINNDEIVGLVTLKDILKIQPALFEILVERFEIREAQEKPFDR